MKEIDNLFYQNLGDKENPCGVFNKKRFSLKISQYLQENASVRVCELQTTASTEGQEIWKGSENLEGSVIMHLKRCKVMSTKDQFKWMLPKEKAY